MKTQIYCVYKTTNKDGYFYIGRGKHLEVVRGKYHGSGTFYKEFRRLNPLGWKTEVLHGPICIEEAKALEVSYVNYDLVSNELCLNMKIMGSTRGCKNPGVYERFRKLCPEFNKNMAIQKAYEARLSYAIVDGGDVNQIEPLSFEESNRYLKNHWLPYAAHFMPEFDDGIPFSHPYEESRAAVYAKQHKHLADLLKLLDYN